MTGSSHSEDMRGRVALVTGGSAGIGLAVVRALAERGATVLLASRAGGTGAEVVEALRRRSGAPEHRFLPADLSSLAEVRALAAEVGRRAPRLHVLVNNAGGFFARRRETVDGLEMTWALDHLAGMLLTLSLLEPLAAAGGRIVTTTSLMARWGRLHRDVNLRRGYNPVLAYAQARLANVLFTLELARRLGPEGPAAHAFDPGVVRTALGQGPGFWNLCIRAAQSLRGRGPEEAAGTAVMLACRPEAGRGGGLWRDGRLRRLPRPARDPAVAARLWRVSLEMLAPSEAELAPLVRLEALERARAASLAASPGAPSPPAGA